MSDKPPTKVLPFGTCAKCGYPLELNWWAGEGFRIDHNLPKSDFPTIEKALNFMRAHE